MRDLVLKQTKDLKDEYGLYALDYANQEKLAVIASIVQKA